MPNTFLVLALYELKGIVRLLEDKGGGDAACCVLRGEAVQRREDIQFSLRSITLPIEGNAVHYKTTASVIGYRQVSPVEVI